MCCQSRGMPRSRVTSHASAADASTWEGGKEPCEANPACSIPTVKSLLCTPLSQQSCRRLSVQSYVAATCHARSLSCTSCEISYAVFCLKKNTRLNSSHLVISYAVFCLKKKKK